MMPDPALEAVRLAACQAFALGRRSNPSPRGTDELEAVLASMEYAELHVMQQVEVAIRKAIEDALEARP